jgi:hypothetical protein
MTPHMCMPNSQAEPDATEFACKTCGTKWKLVETGLGHKWIRK